MVVYKKHFLLNKLTRSTFGETELGSDIYLVAHYLTWHINGSYFWVSWKRACNIVDNTCAIQLWETYTILHPYSSRVSVCSVYARNRHRSAAEHGP